MSISFADKPTLTGPRVVLRPVRASDVDGLAEMVNDPENRRLTGSHPAEYDRDPATQRAALEHWYATRHGHDDRLDLAIVHSATGEFAGEVVLNELDAGNASCNLRIIMRSAFTGKGLGTEAIRLAVDHGFSIGLHRISLEVYAFNARARRSYEKAGFVAEGVLRDALRWDGEWHDAVVMSVLATDRDL